VVRVTRVLVTGASTPAGRAVVQRLADDPRVERILAVQPPKEQPLELNGARAKVVALEADLTHARSIRSLLFGPALEHRCDVVLHLAAHRAACDEGGKVHALNVEATRQLLELSERHPSIRRFVLRSYAEVYRVRPFDATIVAEDHPLELSPHAPQWTRDRVEADLLACALLGVSRMQIAILRCADCPAPETGSQLWDYTRSHVCLVPLGFDPMVNLISVEDLADALQLATLSDATGVFNVPGSDTHPLSVAIERAGRVRVPLPELVLPLLYRWRAAVRGNDFRYDQNHLRFRFSGVLEGERVGERLGYRPHHPVSWDPHAA
jgi:UDP-glucose 4-epimerase